MVTNDIMARGSQVTMIRLLIWEIYILDVTGHQDISRHGTKKKNEQLSLMYEIHIHTPVYSIVTATTVSYIDKSALISP